MKLSGKNDLTPEQYLKRTSQGKRRNCKLTSMNKSKRRQFKPYRGQGKV